MRQFSNATNSSSSPSQTSSNSIMANANGQQQHERMKGSNGSRKRGPASTISQNSNLSSGTNKSDSSQSSTSTNTSSAYEDTLEKNLRYYLENPQEMINVGGEGDNQQQQAPMMTLENLTALMQFKNGYSPLYSTLIASSNATSQCQNGQSMPNSQSSSNSDPTTPKEVKQSPPVPSLPCQMPFGIHQFLHQQQGFQQQKSPPSILQQLSPSTLAAALATIASPQPPAPFCHQAHSHPPPPPPPPPPNVLAAQHHHSPPLFPLSPQQQLFYLLNGQILQQKQQQCNNNINAMPMNGQIQMNGRGNGQQQQQFISHQINALLQTLAQQTNIGANNHHLGIPLLGQQQQQMPMMIRGGGCQQQNGKQRNLTGGSQKSGKKNLLVNHNSTEEGQKSIKRRSSVRSQDSGSVASSQETCSGSSSSTTTLLMNSQQSINSDNGTLSLSNMAISNSIEHVTMEKSNKTTQMIQSNAHETIKQEKQKRGGKSNKEVTSTGGRVPKKTRRMSVDATECSPNMYGSTPSSSKSFIQMDYQNSGQNNISPNGSSLGYSSSPDGTIASPNEGGGRTHFECEWADCHEQFDNSKLFIAHVTDVHVEKEKESAPNFYCRWKSCKRTDPFSAQYMLAQHVRKHTGDKPYLCKHIYENGLKCDKSYSRLENLKTHERTHTGDRPYKCGFENCKKSFTNASDKAKHQNRTHKNEKDYVCPVHRCTKKYTDPSSLRKHVLHEHGKAVWKFAKENKELKKAKNYGVIGIHSDGTPFAMPSGTTSSDEDKEVDVMSTTPPPPGGHQLPTLKENEAEMAMTGTDFTIGGGGGGMDGGNDGGGIGGGGHSMKIMHGIEKQEIKQEPASPTNPTGHQQQLKNQQQMFSAHAHQNIGKNSSSLLLHISSAQNQQQNWQQIGTTVKPNGSPMRSKPTGIAAVLPTRHNNNSIQHFNGVNGDGGHHHQHPSSIHPQSSFMMPSFDNDDFSSPHQNRRLAHGHHHSFDESKRAPNSANSFVEFGIAQHNGSGGTESVQFSSAGRHHQIDHHAAPIVGATTTTAPIEYMPQPHNFGYSKCFDNSASNIIYQQQSIPPHLHHSSNVASAAPVHIYQHQFSAQYSPEKHKQHYSTYIPQHQQRQHTESPQYHHSVGGIMTNINAQQFHQNCIQQQQPISYQPQQSSQQQIMPNGTMAPQRSRHWSGPESGQQVYGGHHHHVHQMPILMDSRQQIPPPYHPHYLNGQIRVPNQNENVDEATVSNLISELQITNNKKNSSK